MTQQLSNCCKAPTTVSSSDEGTSCFMCGECKRACNIANLEALEPGGVLVNKGEYKIMKEQVSVDMQCPYCKNKFAYESGVLNHIKFKRCKALREICNHENVQIDSLSRIYCVDCNLVNVSNMLQASKTIVNKSELERLKRLEANVKKLMIELKLVDGEITPSSLIKLLKSLYDEEQER
jgi:Fe2+ or Zn2+ uptake regulation protein